MGTPMQKAKGGLLMNTGLLLQVAREGSGIVASKERKAEQEEKFFHG